MSSCFRRFSLLTTLLAGLAATLPAQTGEEGGIPDEVREKLRAARGQLSKAREKGELDADRARMTPEERLAAGMRRGSKAHCQFVAACRPPKLLPGQTGTLLVTAILKGRAVLPSPLQMQVTPKMAAGSITVGGLRAYPAQPGTMAKGYIGRPVYENTAEFEFPVTMGNNAPLGSKQKVLLDLQFDIFDGGSAQAVGRFVERVSAEVEVGRFEDPVVAGRKVKPAAPVELETPPAKPPEATEQPKTQPEGLSGNVGIAGSNGDSGSVDSSSTDASGDDSYADELPPTVDEEGGLPLGLLAGGGAILLGIVLLLLRKK